MPDMSSPGMICAPCSNFTGVGRATKSSALNKKSDVLQSEDIRIQCNYSENTAIIIEFDCLNNVPKVMIQANKTGTLVSCDYDFLPQKNLLAILRKKKMCD